MPTEMYIINAIDDGWLCKSRTTSQKAFVELWDDSHASILTLVTASFACQSLRSCSVEILEKQNEN